MMVIGYREEMRSSGEQEWKEVADKMVHPSLLYAWLILCSCLMTSLPVPDVIPCLARPRVRAT
uniref:Uncharacterized protein n=1 Tax=Timema douglasi TaxID=61478 RepID=A0A7R8VY30_TIMDO|nr:unnamed protein product [Timema douglasi]